MAGRAEWDSRNKPPTYRAVQLIPFDLGRPYLVAGESLTLGGGWLTTNNSSAKQSETKGRGPHCDALISSK